MGPRLATEQCSSPGRQSVHDRFGERISPVKAGGSALRGKSGAREGQWEAFRGRGGGHVPGSAGSSGLEGTVKGFWSAGRWGLGNGMESGCPRGPWGSPWGQRGPVLGPSCGGSGEGGEPAWGLVGRRSGLPFHPWQWDHVYLFARVLLPPWLDASALNNVPFYISVDKSRHDRVKAFCCYMPSFWSPVQAL